MEKNYDFRRRFAVVHRPNRRNRAAIPQPGETVIDESWEISYPASSRIMCRAAHDLQDYFLTSMGISLRLAPNGDRGIVLKLKPELNSPGGYELAIDADQIEIRGGDERGVAFGGVGLEDLMNFREAPFLTPGVEKHERLVAPRMVHSGWGIDEFPDDQLNQILHAGFDTIVIFVKDIDRTNTRYLDINDTIRRAAEFGLGTMLYNYMPTFKHPDDADAPEFFANVYTRLFEHYPDAIGVMLCGESGEFPSRDERTTGRSYKTPPPDGIPDPRPNPGWWPCRDYPRWITRVRDAVRRAKPDALIVFNTYNWGWAPEEERRWFLENLPEGVSLQISFDIFKRDRRENLDCEVADYSISAADPGKYFTSEAANAHAVGIRKIFATVNTAGATWDFGTVPYVPTPQRWIRRFRALDEARRRWDVSCFYDNHHYGWWPSVITELGKAWFQSPQRDLDEELHRILVRDFGAAAAPDAAAGYRCWSEAMEDYPATNDDQYGPFRTGPSYPLYFLPELSEYGVRSFFFPTTPGAHFGNLIITPVYLPHPGREAPAQFRFPVELRMLERMRARWDEGIAMMEKALRAVPPEKKEFPARELNLGRYIRNCVTTTIHLKQWWLLSVEILASTDPNFALERLDKMEEIAAAEIANAQETIPLVEFDSRLGWEPSMEYVCDRWHLEWKIRQVNSMLRSLAAYRQKIRRFVMGDHS